LEATNIGTARSSSTVTNNTALGTYNNYTTTAATSHNPHAPYNTYDTTTHNTALDTCNNHTTISAYTYDTSSNCCSDFVFKIYNSSDDRRCCPFVVNEAGTEGENLKEEKNGPSCDNFDQDL
jgi:hypothetical protein